MLNDAFNLINFGRILCIPDADDAAFAKIQGIVKRTRLCAQIIRLRHFDHVKPRWQSGAGNRFTGHFIAFLKNQYDLEERFWIGQF